MVQEQFEMFALYNFIRDFLQKSGGFEFHNYIYIYLHL